MSISEFSVNPKKHIRTCRYNKCKHGGKIDIYKDDYLMIHKGHYYHKDCLEEAKAIARREKKTKNDLKYIRNQWVTHINQTVVFSELNRCLNELLARGISSEYLAFTLDYIIDHRLNLRYPMGFKYFVDKDYIKKAYQAAARKKMWENNELPIDNPTDSPSFKISKPKPTGFGSILRGEKQ